MKMALPPRRILRSIVSDAISDRETFDDVSVAEYTKKTLAEYRAVLKNLAADAPPLSVDDLRVLTNACRHARIWRESLYDAWIHTGEKAILLSARQDIERIDRTEAALGVVHRELEGKNISIFELMKRGDKVNEFKAA